MKKRRAIDKTMPNVDEIQPRRTMMSYAFRSFTPNPISEVKRNKSLGSYATSLFNRLEELQQFTFHPNESLNEEHKKGKENTNSELLESVSERSIKSWVGLDAYRQGLRCFAEDRVTEKRAWQSVLAGRVSEEIKSDAGDSSGYAARIEFKKRKDDTGESSYHHLSAWCQCLDSEARSPKKRSACAHIAAVLISWVRDPSSFKTNLGNEKTAAPEEVEHRLLSGLARLTDRVFSTLEEMISFMLEEKRCSDAEVLDMLQMMYSNMRAVSSQIGERWKELSPNTDKEEFELILGLSFITNVIVSRTLAAIDMKYKNGVMQIKNIADVDALRKVVENFVEMQPRTSRIEIENGRAITISESSVQGGEKENQIGAQIAIKEKNAKKENNSIISRSWDKIVQEFATS